MILTHDEHDSEFLSAMSCTLPVLCCLIVCYIAEIHTYFTLLTLDYNLKTYTTSPLNL